MTARTPRRTTWKPTAEEVQAILAELRPLLHGVESKPPLEGWEVEPDEGESGDRVS